MKPDVRKTSLTELIAYYSKYKRKKKPKFWLSENGSLLPNRFARWEMPFDKITDKDY